MAYLIGFFTVPLSVVHVFGAGDVGGVIHLLGALLGLLIGWYRK